MGYTIFATPWVAMGYELTPDYHERTRLMGTQNFIGQFAFGRHLLQRNVGVAKNGLENVIEIVRYSASHDAKTLQLLDLL